MTKILSGSGTLTVNIYMCFALQKKNYSKESGYTTARARTYWFFPKVYSSSSLFDIKKRKYIKLMSVQKLLKKFFTTYAKAIYGEFL